MEKLFSGFSPNPDWDVSVKEPPRELLQQPFTFLGKGVQCYAFESADKTVVLKLFKHYHAWPSNSVLRELSLPSFLENKRKQTLLARYERVHAIYSSCKIAMEEMPEETGMLYLHLNPTSHLNQKLTFFDKLGIRHEINLDTTPFLLQKKGVVAFEKLSLLMKEGQVEKTKQAISSLLQLIVRRCEKGIVNTDPIVRRNMGYIGETAIEIDTGSFVKNAFCKKPYEIKREVFFETLELKEWLEKHHPDLLAYFQENLDALISS